MASDFPLWTLLGALGTAAGFGAAAWSLAARKRDEGWFRVQMAERQRALELLERQRSQAGHRRDDMHARDELLALNPRIGFFDWGIPLDRLSLGPQWSTMLGHAGEERPGSLQQLRLQIHPADLDSFDEALNLHLQHRRALLDRELRVQHADGHWHWVHLQAKAVTPAEGEVPDRLVGSFFDLHALRLAEESAASERRLFDTGPVIVASLDATAPHRLRSASASAAATLRLPRGSTLVGRGLAELLHPQDLGAVLEGIARVGGQPGASFQQEVRLQLGDGSSRWHALHAVVAGPDGQTLRAYLLDVELLKQAERDAATQAVELQHLVQRLTQAQAVTDRLRELSELIQCAASEEEAHALAGRWGPELLPDWSGSLAFPAVSGQVERRCSWGEVAGPAVQSNEDCWALRRGKPHSAHGEGTATGIVCQHFADRPAPAHSLCIPLPGLSGGDGVLQIERATPLSPDLLRQAESRARSLAETVRLSLSNLQLRLSLQEQATRDWMTGLHNRRHFEDLLPRELNRALRAGEPLALAMIDIDHFKSYNDRYGHEAGDEVIRSVARQLASFGRPYDSRCRVGGEELCILMPRISAEEARQRLEELRQRIAAAVVHHGGQELPAVTVSIGVAEAADGGGPGELMRRADSALYTAKRSGRDRCVVWSAVEERAASAPAA